MHCLLKHLCMFGFVQKANRLLGASVYNLIPVIFEGVSGECRILFMLEN